MFDKFVYGVSAWFIVMGAYYEVNMMVNCGAGLLLGHAMANGAAHWRELKEKERDEMRRGELLREYMKKRREMEEILKAQGAHFKTKTEVPNETM